MMRAWAGVLAAMVATTAVAPAGAASDEQRPVRYVDGTIVALDPQTGATRWVAKPNRGRYLEVGPVGRSVIVATTGRCGGDGLDRSRIVGLDPTTGERRWRSRVEGVPTAAGTAKDRVIVGSRGAIVGLDARTGRRRWKLTTGEMLGATREGVFVHVGRGTSDERVVAHDRARGRKRWQFRLPSTATGFLQTTALVAADARIAVIARGGFGTRYGTADGTQVPGGPTTLFTVDARTGRERHRMVVNDPELQSSLGVLHRGVLALIDGEEITGTDLATGTVVWRHPLTAGPPPGTPGAFTLGGTRGGLTSGRKGRVVIYSERVSRRTFAVDTLTGRRLWARSSLAVLDARAASWTIFLAPLRTFTSEPVEGVDIATGTTRWTRTLRSTYATPSPVLSVREIAPMSVACATP